jgi:hypothetical protein
VESTKTTVCASADGGRNDEVRPAGTIGPSP